MHIKPTKKILSAVFILSLSAISSVEAATDSCLVGKWQPDAKQLKLQFEHLTKQKIKEIAGKFIMNLNNDGKGIYQLDNFSMRTVTANIAEVKVIMNGKSNFSWSTSGQKFAMKSGKFEVKTTGWMDMAGTKIPLPEIPPTKNTQFSSGFANGNYTCTSKTLTFSLPNEDKLLKVWHKYIDD